MADTTATAGPVAELDVREPKRPDDGPAAAEQAEHRSPEEQDESGTPSVPESPEPKYRKRQRERLGRVCKQDRSAWREVLGGSVDGFNRISVRLSAAQTMLEQYCDGPCETMPGWDAVAVKQIIEVAMEWCEEDAGALRAERDELSAIDYADEVEKPAEGTEATEGEAETDSDEPEATAPSDGDGAKPTAKISLDSPWRRLGNVFRDLGRDASRLEAARTLIATDEPDNEKPMDGGDACAVEHIVDQVGEHLEAYRVVIAEVLKSMDVPKPTLVAEPESAEPAPTDGDAESAEDFGPEWSDARWPAFQRAVAALPGFRDSREYDHMLDHFVRGVDDMLLNPRGPGAKGRDETDGEWLEKRCRFVGEHCVPKAVAP